MRCCIHCFQDKYLVNFISQKGEYGDCEFCGTKNAQTIHAYELGGIFEPLIELYEPANSETHFDCLTLAMCLEDWMIFSDELKTESQNHLLDEIRFGDQRFKRRFESTLSSDAWASKDYNLYSASEEDIWCAFADHLKHKRRFLPNCKEFASLSDPRDWLPEMLSAATMEINTQSEFFRAREGFESERFEPRRPLPPDKMGAPPPEIARANRANPAGIPYLYVAEDEETALTEIRPFVGALVSICRIRPKKKLMIADLTKIHLIGKSIWTSEPFSSHRTKSVFTCFESGTRSACGA